MRWLVGWRGNISKDPMDFLFYAFRNPEMAGVISAIMEIGDAEVEE